MANPEKYLSYDGLSDVVTEINQIAAAKQDALVSGTNIKTINNTSLLGSGNISISGGSATDVQINSTSITSNGVADIKTNGTYNASTNKIATMSDLSSYMTTTDPTGTGSISLNRKADTTIGDKSVALGTNTTASGRYAPVALGSNTVASGDSSFASGWKSTASGGYSTAMGSNSTASGDRAVAAGEHATASGNFSVALGKRVTAQRANQLVFGEYNNPDVGGTDGTTRGLYIEIVGNGTYSSAQSNARTLDWSGNEYLAGTLTTSGLKSTTNSAYKLATPTTSSWTADKTIATTDDVSTKVDKTTDPYIVYTTGNGTQTTTQYSINADVSTIVKRTNAGNVRTATPTGDNDATTKKYVDDADATKVDKTSTASQVYVTDSSGNQTTLNYDTTFDAFTSGGFIVKRDNDGQIYTRTTPTDNKHVTSKSYVDGLKMIPSDNTATYSTAPTTGTTVMTAPANGVAYVRYALQGSGSIGIHLRTSGNQDLAYNTQNFDTNGYHIYTATFVMKSGQKLYCYENALSNSWGAIIFIKSEGQS